MAKGRSTLILFAGILVLGGVIWFQEMWRAKVPSRKMQEIRLFDLNPETLISLHFEHTNNVLVECVKENGIWMTGGTGGGMGRADVASIHQLVAGLNSMGKGTTITAKHLKMRGLDAAEYGFNVPMIAIKAVDNRGWHHWLVGRETPLGDMVYVKEGNRDDIYTVLDQLLELVPTEPDELRDRSLFAGKPESVRRIEIRGAGGLVQILKDASLEWQIQQPLSVAADPTAVGDLLGKLYRLRIEEFVAENVSDFSVYGLQVEARQISLGGADGTSRMLVIGDEPADRPGMVYARRADDTAVFLMSNEILALVDIKSDSLRDASVLPVPAREIKYIRISRGAEQIELVADGDGKWTITKPVMWDADLDAVDELIKLWDLAVITEFNETNAPAAAAEWTLQFGSAEPGLTNRIEILPALGDRTGLCIRREDDPTIYRINLPQVPDSILDPLAFKDRQLWRLRKDDIQKISVEKVPPSRQVVERQEDGTFAAMETNSTVRVDEDALGRMLNVLGAVSTREYVAYNPRDLSIYGLADPSIVLQMGFAGTNQLGRVLLVGQEAATGYYAMVKGQDVVCILDKSLVEILSADLVSQLETTVPDTE